MNPGDKVFVEGVVELDGYGDIFVSYKDQYGQSLRSYPAKSTVHLRSEFIRETNLHIFRVYNK